MASLCEVPTIRNEEDSASIKIQNISTVLPLLPVLSVDWEQSGFWWSNNRYWRCPKGHLTHSFLACDVQALCWASDPFSYDASCSVSGMTSSRPLPPAMMCVNGVQHVPYSLVCDGRPDCSDQSDEIFCTFVSCDILTQFTCDDRTCLPTAVECDGKSDCRDSSDEKRCIIGKDHYENNKTVIPPALLVFRSAGHSDVMPLSAALSLNGLLVGGTVVQGNLTNVTLIGPTLIHGTFTNETVVSGTVVSGILDGEMLFSGKLVTESLVSGTLVASESLLSSGTIVSGTLDSGLLVSSKLEHGVLKEGVLVNATLVSSKASCPDSHFWCADKRYCIPVFTRCNGLYDCPGHEDEADCDSYQCPGFYRCRGARVCLHRFDICDGVSHCPQHDDEMLCDLACPLGCTCYGLSFYCRHQNDVKTSVAPYPQLRYLDASDSAVNTSEVEDNTMLIHLSLVRCHVANWGPVSLPNLLSLDLSENNITRISSQFLYQLPNLRHLTLAYNPFNTEFMPEMTQFGPVHSLRSLDMSGVLLTELNVSVLSVFRSLQTLNFTKCCLQRVRGNGFQSLRQLRVLDLRGNPLTYFPRHVFRGLSDLRTLYADNYKLCCPTTLPDGFHHQNCKAPTDAVSSCEALLRSEFFRVCLYVFAVLSCVGNLSSLMCRLKVGQAMRKIGFDVFVVNLSVSDLLMGVYLVIIGAADRLYMGTYLWSELTWRHSTTCKVAGFLSLVSNEVSAFMVSLITLDRFLVLRFPFSQLRFSSTTAFIASTFVWGTSFIIAGVPLLPQTTHWQFYSQTGICIPLPTSQNDFEGQRYSFGVMIVLNFVLFVEVALGQLLVYMSVQKHKMSTMVNTSSALRKDQTLARRLLTVALSDFLCWFPVGLVGLMTARGHHLPGEVNVAIAIFGLPLNSAINPFLYTLNIEMERRRQARELRIKQFFMAQIKAQQGTYSGGDGNVGMQ